MKNRVGIFARWKRGFISKQGSSKFFRKPRILWLGFWIGLLMFGFYRINQIQTFPNLLTNPDFETPELTGWQIVSGENANTSLQSDSSNNMVLVFNIPQGSWGGFGQNVVVSPLQRYSFKVNYRTTPEQESSSQIIVRLSQFDHNGSLIKEDELLCSEAACSNNKANSLAWNLLNYKFITDKQTATAAIGIGFRGERAVDVEIDNATLRLYPTWFGLISRDVGITALLLLLAAIIIYRLSRMAWPIRRKLIINGGLALASLILTLVVAEIAVRFIPIRLMNMAHIWAPGYLVSFMDGKSYRLATSFPQTFYTYGSGENAVTHLLMTNSIGVRDVQLPSPTENKTIILVLGDSMTFGWNIENIDDTWPRRLNEQIAKTLPSNQYHIVNSGVPGYNTYQEVLLFETLIQDMEQLGLKPKIALLSFYSGIWDRNLYGLEGRYNVVNDVLVFNSFRRAILNLPDRIAKNSSLDDFKLLYPAWSDPINQTHQMLLSNSRLYFILAILLTNRFGGEDWSKSTPDFDDPRVANYEALKLFEQTAEANEILPVVALLPGDYAFMPPLTEPNKVIRQQLSDISLDLGIIFIDPFDNMQKLGIDEYNAAEKLTLGYDPHYSPQGNMIYAKSLAPLLADVLNNFETTATHGTVWQENDLKRESD